MKRRGRPASSRDKLPVKEKALELEDRVDPAPQLDEKYIGHDKYPDLVNKFHPNAFSQTRGIFWTIIILAIGFISI